MRGKRRHDAGGGSQLEAPQLIRTNAGAFSGGETRSRCGDAQVKEERRVDLEDVGRGRCLARLTMLISGQR